MKPKFRAWTEEGKVMYYDVYPFKDDTLLLSYDEIAFDEVPASDFILMQSTGLFDVNGKEIFEGDIVLENGWRKIAVSFGTQEIEESYGDIVIYQGFNLNLGGGYPKAVMSKHEVIGNVYQNPELLGGK